MANENTVSVEAGSTAVVGNLTLFTAAEGDIFLLNGMAAEILRQESASLLRLRFPWPGPTLTDRADWSIQTLGEYWRSTVTTNKLVTDLIRKIDGGLPLRPDAAGTLAQRDQYNGQGQGFLYLRIDVDPMLLYVKTGPGAGDWSAGQRLRADPAESTFEAQQAAVAAAQSASTANARANAAQISAGDAAASESRAHDWAEKPVDQDVAGPGTRSALHHAAKADAARVAAEQAASQAQEGVVPDNGVSTQKIVDKAVTLAKMADMATSSLLGRRTGGVGSPEVLTLAEVKALLALDRVDNIIDNPRFAVNQRQHTGGAIAANTYFVDRWKAGSGGATVSAFTPSAVPQGLMINISSGSILQIIDRADIEGGIQHVLSWAGTATARVYNSGGAAPAYSASPIAFTPDGAADLVVEFTGGTVDKILLHQGSVATIFRPRKFGEELRRCQRYYWHTYNYGTAPNALTTTGAVAALGNSNSRFRAAVKFPVEMRATPTVTYYNPVVSAIGTARNTSVGANAAVATVYSGTSSLVWSATVADNNEALVHLAASAEP